MNSQLVLTQSVVADAGQSHTECSHVKQVYFSVLHLLVVHSTSYMAASRSHMHTDKNNAEIYFQLLYISCSKNKTNKTETGDGSFSVATPRIWNLLLIYFKPERFSSMMHIIYRNDLTTVPSMPHFLSYRCTQWVLCYYLLLPY